MLLCFYFSFVLLNEYRRSIAIQTDIQNYVLCLQISCMIHGPQPWLSVPSASAFYPCYQVQPLRFVQIVEVSTTPPPPKKKKTPKASLLAHYPKTNMWKILSLCSNAQQIMIGMWKTVGMVDLPRRQGGGSMMIKCNAIYI